ncbi:MAG: DUF541 domain-containing protein [Streptosporangiales bacterium]|nr:DUF541 domain-containing protein [Streptosporangiales bacterium]
MAEVTTTGSGEVKHRADRATVSAYYRATGGDRTRAVDALTHVVEPVEAVLRREGLRIRSRELSVHDTWHKGRRSSAEAEQRYEVRVADLEILDEVVAELVAAEPAHLYGPRWELKDTAAATREAQALAVADARQRAEGYAIALGARLGKFLRLTEGGAQGPGPFMAMDGAVAYAGGAPERAVDIGALNLEPELISVQVTCSTVWELLD